MADYDWFTPSKEQLRKEAEHKQWLEDNHLVEIPSDDIHSRNKKLGCTLCGCRLISGNYLLVHRSKCYEVEEYNGKHRLDRDSQPQQS